MGLVSNLTNDNTYMLFMKRDIVARNNHPTGKK